jgi:membrane fusion protein (multidrug efflux system)
MQSARQPRLLLPVLFACAAALLSACGPSDQAGKGRGAEHTVEAATARLESGRQPLEVSAVLNARQTVKVLNEEQGRLVELEAYEGDRVAAGQVLARMDDGLLRAELTKAQARRKEAVAQWKRLQVMARQGMVSQEVYSKARTEVEVASADERLLAKRVSYLTLRSPIDGVVSERHIEAGDLAQPYTHLYTVLDDSALRAQVRVSGDMLARIDDQTPVRIRIDALGGEAHPAHILRIFPAMDPSTHQGTVEVELSPVPQGARPGQLGRVELNLLPPLSPMIPVIALRQDEQGAYVYRIDKDSKARRVAVQAGRYQGDQVAIVRGLAAGDRVVTRGFLGLKPGKPVVVVDHGAD